MKIDCEQCGNCCPRWCNHLTPSEDDPKKVLCLNHETRVAPNVCDLPPITWLSTGTACKACIHVLQRLVPNLELETYVDDDGITKINMLNLTQEVRSLISQLKAEARV